MLRTTRVARRGGGKARRSGKTKPTGAAAAGVPAGIDNPQPLAVESIARRTSVRLKLVIALSCQGESFARMNSAAEAVQEVGAGRRRPAEAGGGRRLARRGGGLLPRRYVFSCTPADSVQLQADSCTCRPTVARLGQCSVAADSCTSGFFLLRLYGTEQSVFA
eukprot:scaffold100993_cov66-Phaeocystis_antarctica.AAC.2